MFVSSAEIDKERTSLENVPSNYIESVCMPDFDEFFQQAGGVGYPLPEHKVTPVMNGNSGPSSSGASSSTSGSFIDGESRLQLIFILLIVIIVFIDTHWKPLFAIQFISISIIISY